MGVAYMDRGMRRGEGDGDGDGAGAGAGAGQEGERDHDEARDEETGSNASERSEPPLTCRERGREWLRCLRREWPAGVIMMVVTLWVLDHTVNKYGLWRRMSAGWWYGNYERLR